MPDYRISREARFQLDGIYEYTEFRFGAKRADVYATGLTQTFQRLADSPRLGKALKGFVPPLRRYRFQSHFRFFNVEPDHVLIRAVHHARRNFVPDLIE